VEALPTVTCADREQLRKKSTAKLEFGAACKRFVSFRKREGNLGWFGEVR